MLSYPVRLVPTDHHTIKVVFLDVPEAVAEGATEADALHQAKVALELALGHRLHSQRDIPVPSAAAEAPIVMTEKYILQPTVTPISGGRY